MSIILTLNLWSYQPSIEKSGDRPMVKEVLLSEKKDTKDIVRIEQMIFNLKGNYYGTLSTEKIDNLMKAVSSWEFISFSPSDHIDIDVIAESHDSVQIIYPGEIPMDLFVSIYNIGKKEVPIFYFNKILIDFKSTDYGYGNVYFISEENQQVYSSYVSTTSLKQFSQEFFEEAKQYNKYFPFKTGTGQTIYLPEDETQLVNSQYIRKKLRVSDLKNALFKDPSIVEKTTISSEEEYTDGKKLLIADNDRHLIRFFGLSVIESQDKNIDGLLQKSINYVNNHGGWTDNYRFIEFDKARKIAHFRIYGPDGYPVFGENDPISKIEIDWADTDISSYLRNNFSLGVPAIKPIKTLDSGHDAIEKIKEREGEQFNLNLLKDIKIGYKMTVSATIISLEPDWFYFYGGEWKSIQVNEVGGEEVGLE